MEDRAGKTATGRSDTGAALAMLTAFASVGARVFDLTITDLAGKKVQGLQRTGENLEQLRRRIGRDLQDAERNRHNVIIRPRSTTALLIQLDDFDDEKAKSLEPFSFMTLRTSPGNGQVWLAVSDGPKESDEAAAKQFKTRVRRGAGADPSATGATRIAGSLNFKPDYAPDFPVVMLGHVKGGSTVTIAALDKAGLIAAQEQEQPMPPASVPRAIVRPGRTMTAGEKPRRSPDYQQALGVAPKKEDGTPDRSMADFIFCIWAIRRGYGIKDTAEMLAKESKKAQERIQKDDQGYTVLTARNAAAAVERDKHRRPSVKATTGPR